MTELSRFVLGPEDFPVALSVFADALASGRVRQLIVEQRTEFEERSDLVSRQPIAVVYSMEVRMEPDRG